MLEDVVFQTLKDVSPVETLGFAWMGNPLHPLGIIGGIVSGYRGSLKGVVAASLCTFLPELYSYAHDDTPLFEVAIPFFFDTGVALGSLLLAHARASFECYKEKNFLPRDYPFRSLLASSFDRFLSRPRSWIQQTASDVTSLLSHHPKLGFPAIGSLLIAGCYALPDSLQSDAQNFLHHHPSLLVGAGLGALTGYLQKPYTNLAAWSGILSVPLIGLLQLQNDHDYIPLQGMQDFAMGVPLAHFAHVGGKALRRHYKDNKPKNL